jgi:type I restriction enzyme R subunit
VNLAKNMQTHPDFKAKYAENADTQNRDIAFDKIFADIMSKQRKLELDLYKKVTQDDSFRIAMQDTLKRILSA